MATLGEAFIAVKANLSPFRRGLKPEVEAVAKDFEAAISKAVDEGIAKGAKNSAGKAGSKAGDDLGKGIKSKLGDSKSSPWSSIASAFAAALDDGISALPTEVKVAILGALVAVAPLLIASLAGAISAGVVAGFAVLGAVLATQFQSVRDRWTEFSNSARETLVRAAAPFEGALLQAMDVTESRLTEWGPMLAEIFQTSAPFLEKIVAGLLDGVGAFLESMNRGLKNAEPFAEALSDALFIVASAAGEALEILLATGEDGTKAFRDLIYILASMLVFLAQVIAFFAEMYALVRKVAQATPDWVGVLLPPVLLLKGLANETDAANEATSEYEKTNRKYTTSIYGVVSATKDQEKVLKDLQKSIEDAQEAAFRSVDVNIRWEESIDDLTESFRKNGNTIDITTKEGRANLRELGDAIKAAQDRAEDRYKSGELNAEQARALYQKELEVIYQIGAQFGITKDQIDKAYGAALQFSTVPPPDLTWVQRMADGIAASLRDMRKLREEWNLGPNRIGGNQPFADGGIVRQPTNALIGEAGAEVVLPMTRPGRAMQLLEESGLASMLSRGGDIAVSVFLGNEAFDQHVQKIVVQDNRNQSRQLGFGVR